MKEYITGGLIKFGGNRRKTAKFLGIAPRTLRAFMAENPDLKDQFPSHNYVEQKYKQHPKENSAVLKISRHYKSLLKYQYKIKGKTFDTIQDIADYNGVNHATASAWIKNKMTDDRDIIRVISLPINWDGSSANME